MDGRGMESISMSALLNVLIYSGPGTSEFSVNQTLRTLKKFLKSSYDVKLIGSDVLKNDKIPWDESCALFVMPGGRDLVYLDEFKGTNFFKRLKGKVKYLGICAGAYFAADRIEFEMGRTGYEVKGDRPLKLIDTLAKGALETGKLFYYSDDYTESKEQQHSIQAINIKTIIDNKNLKVAYNGGCYFPQARCDLIYAVYGDNQPIILLKDNDFCLSGVHFEYDAINCADKTTVFCELIKYENDRETLIKDVLKRLGLNVTDGRQELNELESIKIFTNHKINHFNQLNDKNIEIISSSNADNCLKSDKFVVLYSKICTSTQTILLNEPNLLDTLPNYSVYVAEHQVKGKGRSNNLWISSPACLQFTLKVEFPIGKCHRLPLLQFLMAVSLTETVNSLKFKNQMMKAKIKWPNDIYLCENNEKLIGKLSGILVNCLQSHEKRVNHVLIGVGVNILSDPFSSNITHLNDYLIKDCGKEEFLNELLERFKYLYDEFLLTDMFPFKDYYGNWLHSNQMIETESIKSKLIIKGINEFGYLIAKDVANDNLHEFEPDGNSFDMTRNLIKRK